MAEKTKEQLQAAAEKAASTMYAIIKKRNEVEKELESNPEDGKLKKRFEELEKAVQKAKDEHSAAMEAVTAALKEAEKAAAGTDDARGAAGSGKKIRLKVRNKTGRPTYYRSGLCFGQVDAEYAVTKDVADILLADSWLIVEEVK